MKFVLLVLLMLVSGCSSMPSRCDMAQAAQVLNPASTNEQDTEWVSVYVCHESPNASQMSLEDYLKRGNQLMSDLMKAKAKALANEADALRKKFDAKAEQYSPPTEHQTPQSSDPK